MVFNEENISDPGFNWLTEPELQLFNHKKSRRDNIYQGEGLSHFKILTCSKFLEKQTYIFYIL